MEIHSKKGHGKFLIKLVHLKEAFKSWNEYDEDKHVSGSYIAWPMNSTAKIANWGQKPPKVANRQDTRNYNVEVNVFWSDLQVGCGRVENEIGVVH